MTASIVGKSVPGLNWAVRVTTISAVCIAMTACGGGGAENQETTSHDMSISSAASPNAVPVVTWTKVADQGLYFQAVNTVPIRFGYGDKWVKQRLSGKVRCDLATFGSDPAPGETKVCESKDTSLAPGSATLDWVASTDPAVIGYRVYYGTTPRTYLQAPGAGFDAGLQRTFAIAGLPTGATYYFAVTAVDASGAESTFSNEVTKLIP